MKNFEDLKPTLNYNDVRVLDVELRHKGFCRVEKHTLKNRLFAGGWTPPYTRELVTRRRAAAALPYDPILDKVVLIEQFRVGTIENRTSDETPWLLEVVAGLMDKEHHESDEELMRREMREEAGLEILELVPIYDYFASPGILTERVKLFYATVDASKAPTSGGVAHEHEDIRVHVVSSDTAITALHSGRIINAAAIIALQWLELNRERIRRHVGAGTSRPNKTSCA